MPPENSHAIIGSALRRAAAALVLIFAGAAGAIAQPAPPKNDGGRCVGVVSAIGDTITLKKVGITIFNNEESKAPVEAWRIDDLVFGKVTSILGKRFNLKRVNYPKGAFATLEEDHGLFHNLEDDLNGVLRRITAPTKCDQYIAVLKTGSALGSSNQRLYGLGLLEASGIYSEYYLHTIFTVRLYDGQNFSILAQHVASIGQRTFLATIRGPNREVDKTWWPSSDPAQSAQLRDGIRALVGQSLDATLPEFLRAE